MEAAAHKNLLPIYCRGRETKSLPLLIAVLTMVLTDYLSLVKQCQDSILAKA